MEKKRKYNCSDDIIKWSVVSELISGSRYKIRRDFIPSKHKDKSDKIEELKQYIEQWKKDINGVK